MVDKSKKAGYNILELNKGRDPRCYGRVVTVVFLRSLKKGGFFAIFLFADANTSGFDEYDIISGLDKQC